MADAARDAARRRSMSVSQAAGLRGEDLAHRFLEKKGFTVVMRNYRPPSGPGEIDVVAWERDRLVFVEVKSRHSDKFGSPERNIDEEKQRLLFRAGQDYARRAGVSWENVRFDVVSILLTDPPSYEHLRDVFPLKTL